MASPMIQHAIPASAEATPDRTQDRSLLSGMFLPSCFTGQAEIH